MSGTGAPAEADKGMRGGGSRAPRNSPGCAPKRCVHLERRRRFLWNWACLRGG
jgi:hypothetical protein